MNGEQLLAQAARTLREHTDSGWVTLRDDVVAAAVRAFRPSAPVRGRLPGGELLVASAVLVSRVGSAVAEVADAGALPPPRSPRRSAWPTPRWTASVSTSPCRTSPPTHACSEPSPACRPPRTASS